MLDIESQLCPQEKTVAATGFNRPAISAFSFTFLLLLCLSPNIYYYYHFVSAFYFRLPQIGGLLGKALMNEHGLWAAHWSKVILLPRLGWFQGHD